LLLAFQLSFPTIFSKSNQVKFLSQLPKIFNRWTNGGLKSNKKA